MLTLNIRGCFFNNINNNIKHPSHMLILEKKYLLTWTNRCVKQMTWNRVFCPTVMNNYCGRLESSWDFVNGATTEVGACLHNLQWPNSFTAKFNLTTSSQRTTTLKESQPNVSLRLHSECWSVMCYCFVAGSPLSLYLFICFWCLREIIFERVFCGT